MKETPRCKEHLHLQRNIEKVEGKERAHKQKKVPNKEESKRTKNLQEANVQN